MKFVYAGSLAVLLSLSHLAASVQGQAQEGNNNDNSISRDDSSAIHNGYYSYVADMDSADSVRQAMETVSWASVGSSWMVVQATEGVESEAQVQATPSSSPSQAAVGAIATEPASLKLEPESTPTPASSSTSSASSTNKNLAIGLGVGIPLALLAILSIITVVIYKKRQSTRRDFEKRTANLRNMTQTDV